jgi:hypothetical protein
MIVGLPGQCVGPICALPRTGQAQVPSQGRGPEGLVIGHPRGVLRETLPGSWRGAIPSESAQGAFVPDREAAVRHGLNSCSGQACALLVPICGWTSTWSSTSAQPTGLADAHQQRAAPRRQAGTQGYMT